MSFKTKLIRFFKRPQEAPLKIRFVTDPKHFGEWGENDSMLLRNFLAASLGNRMMLRLLRRQRMDTHCSMPMCSMRGNGVSEERVKGFALAISGIRQLAIKNTEQYQSDNELYRLNADSPPQ